MKEMLESKVDTESPDPPGFKWFIISLFKEL
jgi:hypothetical protein